MTLPDQQPPHLPAIALAGPTASGKTAGALALARGGTREGLADAASDLSGALMDLRRPMSALANALAAEHVDVYLSWGEPPAAVAELRLVPLYFSPEYPGVPPRAEFHPDAGWLRDHGRNPAMAKGVQFTNIPNFEAETRRMPNFALHELAHAYHDQVLSYGAPPVRFVRAMMLYEAIR